MCHSAVGLVFNALIKNLIGEGGGRIGCSGDDAYQHIYQGDNVLLATLGSRKPGDDRIKQIPWNFFRAEADVEARREQCQGAEPPAAPLWFQVTSFCQAC